MVDLGPTGTFPRGKLNEDDEGGLQLAVASDKSSKTVIVDFGKPVVWIGLGPEEALALAAMLERRAKELTDEG